MVNAQEWLDSNYPKKERKKITVLDIRIKNLTGELKISGFNNLTKLNCYNNQLTNLELNGCVNLTWLYCNNNQLTNLELNGCVNLTRLDCSDNQLTNLELNECVNLTEFNIQNTDINIELEYLPTSLEKIYCNGKLATELEDYRDKDGYYDYQAWKKWLIWKQKGFTQKEINHWKSLGLTLDELDLALYLKENNIKLEQELPKHKRIYERMPTNAILFQRWKKTNEKLFTKINSQNLQDQLKFLEAEKERLIRRNLDLETLITESKNLVSKEKAEIVEKYEYSFTENERDALQELIAAHKDYKKTQKENQPCSKLFKEFLTLYQTLENKLGESFIEAVENILNNFEQLYQYEWIIEKQLTEKEQIPTKLENIEEYIKEIKQNIKLLQDKPSQKIINKYITTGDIKGHLLIDNNFGNDVNLSQNTNNNVQVGDISIEHSQFADSVTIGVGEIVNNELNTANQTKLVEEKIQTQMEVPPKN